MPADSVDPRKLSTGQKWGIAGMGAAATLPMLFGSDGGTSDYERQLGHLTEDTLDTSKSLGIDAKGLYANLLPYIQAMAGGDRQALLSATMPERKRVIDQYSAARKAIGEFAPRSGGQAAAMSSLRGQEASDLALIGGQARQQGVNLGANLAGNLMAGSQAASGQAASNLNALSEMTLARQQQNAAMAGQLGQSLGMLAGLAFL